MSVDVINCPVSVVVAVAVAMETVEVVVGFVAADAVMVVVMKGVTDVVIVPDTVTVWV